ncbi:MAG: peptide ABC transporter permease [Rhodocyclales bacterium RIFCSPLOWO2_02_FULL_63_24]|nr:MAG: peptide ABC transporter permease [Rhodocyclales bacterium GWA2_65_19]OHC71642.1 MAG: peptide ABC transporter permease [Rhodocyclales bacterium RIFCSPLOWO2_02_FULL_63_24]
MSFQIVLLWSDALLFVLIAAIVGLALWARRQDALRAAWGRVLKDGVAMAAATVLAVFVLIGLLDSLHYRARLEAQPGAAARYAVEVNSALDALLSDLRQRGEKTYSAPLATHLFAKEALENSTQREFPRLKHGGAHLGQDLSGHEFDIALRLSRGLAAALAVWLALVALVSRTRKQEFMAVLRVMRSGIPGDGAGNDPKVVQSKATGAVLVALLAILLLFGVALSLGGGYHVFGTDKVGQDVLYLSLKSIRTGLLIGTLTTLVMLPLAVLLGILAGYVGGWVDDLIQYLYTTLSSIPGVLLIAAAVLMMQVIIDTHPQWFATSAERADARLLALCLILGMTSWTGVARLLRGETLKLRELEFVQAAQAFGVGRFAIMRRHILPNLMHIVLIALVMDFSGLVLAEAVLSYVGVGVDPTTISFGTMINTARMELAREPMVWWSLAAAFSFMFALVLAANLFADAVRDAFDPRSST